MSVVIETTLGDITVDLYLDQRPVTCLNFLKLCKMKYYNFNLFHSIRSGFIAQTGDPTAEGSGGESIFGLLEGPEKRFFSGEKLPKIRHTNTGTLAMVCTGDMMVGSQFFFTLAPDLDSLDNVHCAIGEVTEGHDVLRMLNDVICDETHRPYRDVRITHTVVLEDPFNDPPGLRAPSRSPSPNSERLKGGRIAPDEDIDEGQGKSAHEIQEIIEEKEAKARATILEIVGDLPDADIAPPENVLFVCKLNPVTTDEDLEIIFSRFGKIVGCEVIRDKKTGDSLQYAFIEFDDKKSCEDAYFKMDNVLIDDRRIHVDFSQSVSRMRWMGKGKGIKYYNNNGPKEEFRENNSSRNSHNHDKKDYGNGKNEETNRRQHERRDLSSHTDKKDRDDNYGRSDRHDRHKRSDRDRSRRDRSRSRTNTDRQRSKRDKSLEKSDKDGKSKDKSREDRLRRDRSRSRDKSRHHEHKKDTSSRRDRSRSNDKTRYHEEKSRSRKDKSISKDRASENKNGGFTERERSKKDRSNSRDRSRWDRFTKDINNRSTKSSRRDRSRSRGMSKHCEDKTHDSSNSARKHRSSSKEGETNTEQMSRNNKISSQNVDSSIKRHLSPSSKYVKETKSLHCKEVYEKSTDKNNTQSFTTRYWTQLETEKKEINNSNRSFKSEKHQKSTEKIWNNTDEYVNNSEPKNTSSSKHTNKNYSDIEENYLQQREGKNTESRKHSSNELHEEPQRSPVRKSDLSKSKKSDKNDKDKDHRTPTPVTDRKGKSTKIKTKKKVKVLKKKRKESTSSSDSSSSSSSESSSSEEDRKKKSAKHRKRKVSSSSSSSTSSSSSSSSSSESSSSSSSSDSEPSKKKRKKVVSGKVHKGKKSKNKL